MTIFIISYSIYRIYREEHGDFILRHGINLVSMNEVYVSYSDPQVHLQPYLVHSIHSFILFLQK